METWEKVQEKMHEQKVKYRKYYDPDRKELSHWLVGIVRCEKCGAVLSNQGGFYGCSNRSRGTCKGVGYIKTSKLDGIVLNALSDVALPNVKLAFAEPETIERVETEDESLIISTQIQRLEIRLDRVKLAYEDGVDTLQEYKANKKSLLDEIANLKALMKEKKAEEPPKTVEKINKKELRRLTDVLKDESVSNVEKNKVARTIFKEIVKGGDDGKTIKCVFWK